MLDDGSGVRRLTSSSRTRVCPAFCGRIATTWPSGNITYSDCQACGWGSRSIEKYLCAPCEESLPLYDWLYLAFVAIVPLLIHSFFIQFYAPKSRFFIYSILIFSCLSMEMIRCFHVWIISFSSLFHLNFKRIFAEVVEDLELCITFLTSLYVRKCFQHFVSKFLLVEDEKVQHFIGNLN
uniref:JNK1/MAPK8-associated membrane protein n=1 Tax=Ascaris lumbricoides TaxID=6252 RepID=A0A0M3IVD5_ASCLU